MKATVIVDEVGRLVLPKRIREAIGISGRMSLNVEVVDNSARISTPESTVRNVSRKRGRLVYLGELPADWDSGEAIENMRERRIQR